MDQFLHLKKSSGLRRVMLNREQRGDQVGGEREEMGRADFVACLLAGLGSGWLLGAWMEMCLSESLRWHSFLMISKSSVTQKDITMR